MSCSRRARVLSTLIATLAVIGLSGCSPSDDAAVRSATTTLPTLQYAPSSTTTTSPAPVAVDYRRLLLSAADLSDADDTFSARSTASQPNGTTGATGFFVNDEDTRAISDTFVIYPDAATATAALRQATTALPGQVTGGNATPTAVGTDGVVITGTHPEENKAVTVLLFTEGQALVRLEFQSATGDATTDRFVTSIGKMQQIALRVGLAEEQQR